MKKPILIIGGVVLLVLLTGAAYVGGRLLNGQGVPGFGPGGPAFFMGNGNGNRQIRLSDKDFLPAKELPQTPALEKGVFVRRQDNSIYIGTGEVRITVQKDRSGNVQSSADHDGPTVEVVVTGQTTIYEDVTMQQFDGPPPEGQKIQQVVQPGSLDGIGDSSMIIIWGRKTGDRVIADVLVYTQPAFIKKR